MIANFFNWLSAARVFVVVVNPFAFFAAVLRKEAPAEVRLRTPTGPITIRLRNFESLRTVFSIFCRQDYKTETDGPSRFLDIGANIGIASAYFLSRNKANRVQCYEPDPDNLELLRTNMRPFGERAVIVTSAVCAKAGQVSFFRSEDGKYSSLYKSERATIPVVVDGRAFSDVLKETTRDGQPVVVKLDVEGAELDLVKCVRFEDYPLVSRLICESTECAQWVSRPHRRSVVSGYVEDIAFGT